jgi:hypothetical protein
VDGGVPGVARLHKLRVETKSKGASLVEDAPFDFAKYLLFLYTF